MEGNTYEFTLKKAVAMFNELVDIKQSPALTTAQADTFLRLFDTAEAYATAQQPPKAAEPSPWERAAEETASGTVKLEVPVFIGREIEEAIPEPEPEPAENAPAKKYSPPPIRTEDRKKIPGYDWQIVVLDREKGWGNSYAVHFAVKPTLSEFKEHYALYEARTHYVHCNEWIDGAWVNITVTYAKFCLKPTRDVSAPQLADPWAEEDKPFRVRHYSAEAGEIVYTYVDKKPVGRDMAMYHHTKCLAAVQARPTN